MKHEDITLIILGIMWVFAADPATARFILALFVITAFFSLRKRR